MTRPDLSVAGAYLFFVVILVQNTAALALVSTGVAVPVSPFYEVKFLLLIAVVWLLLVTRTLPRIGGVEMTAVVTIFVVTALAVAKGGGVWYEADELKFYVVPILLYFVGRATAPFKRDRQLAYFLMTLGILYVVLGTAYELIGRDALADAGLKALLGEKLNGIGRADELVNGLPINFWFFRSNGQMIPRAIGALFDPLASAYFGVTLFFYLWEIHRRRVVAGAGYLAAAVAVLIGLTFTRAMILGIVIVFVASLLHKKGIAAMPLWPAIVAGVVGVVMLATNVDSIVPLLDPSSGGHLRAYLQLDVTSSLIGHRFAVDAPRGEESLYSTIFFECGIAGLICFLTWFVQLYFRIRKLIGYPFARATFESLIIYLLASFTTEHLFASSSCGLFWFLFGNSLTAIDQAKANSGPEIHVGTGDLSHATGGEILPASQYTTALCQEFPHSANLDGNEDKS
jgi:hypothetical protein